MLLISFGTRPEWIKIKPIVDEIEGEIPYKILFTGQHTSLVEEYLEDTFILNDIEDGDNRLDSIVCSLLNRDSIFEDITHVLVQGDTTSAFAVGLAAFHRNIPVIHLEAGLRTYDNQNPYPEEFNRTALTALATIHLCPTKDSSKNLIPTMQVDDKIYSPGNTVLDNLRGMEPEVQEKVLVTMHRRENHENIKEWFEEINKIAKDYPELEFMMPLHPNPNVVRHKDILTDVRVVDPLSHAECIEFIRTCKTIITDSGGIQEESSFFKKKCIVCRKITERKEGIGVFAFMCPSPQDLSNVFDGIINKGEFLVDEECPYGDGLAAQYIKNIFIREGV
tara:strand:- start:170 stop:1174 length:1005 start_codon:yes stop_codon:yes gene_type:complete